MGTEAETGGVCPHGPEQLEPPEGGKVKRASSLDSSGLCVLGASLPLGFWPPELWENPFLLR